MKILTQGELILLRAILQDHKTILIQNLSGERWQPEELKTTENLIEFFAPEEDKCKWKRKYAKLDGSTPLSGRKFERLLKLSNESIATVQRQSCALIWAKPWNSGNMPERSSDCGKADRDNYIHNQVDKKASHTYSEERQKNESHQ
jgi:hypothetical protein